MRPTPGSDGGLALDAEVLVDGPFAASTLFWRARRGELRCSILVKTTYALLPRVCPLVDPPEPLLPADEHWDASPAKSVRTPSDIVPFKHAPEVLLVGHAYAPGRRPQKRLGVRLVVGDLDMALEVFPPRRFDEGGVLEEPSAARMPLAYEFAAGGEATDNPVGVDSGLADAWGRRDAPSVLQLGAVCEHPDDAVDLAGWGPIAPSWPSRARRLRAEDRAWLDAPAAAPMPPAFDVRYFQSAPRAQWLSGPIRADERLLLENLSAAHERLATSLDGTAPYAAVLGAKELRIPLLADTLFIDTDRAVVTLTWRGLLLVDERSSRITVAISRSTGRPSQLPTPMPADRAALLAEIETTHTETPTNGVGMAALMFSASELDAPTPGAGRAPVLPGVPAERAPSVVPGAGRAPSVVPGAGRAPSVSPGLGAERPSPVSPISQATPPLPSVVPGGPAAPPPEPSGAGPVQSGWTSFRAADGAADPSSWVGKASEHRTEGERDRLFFVEASEPRRHALVDLLAHDAALAARMRRTPALASLLAASAERASWPQPGDPDGGRPAEERDRLDVLRALSFGAPCDLPRVRDLIDEAFDDPAQLELPLAIVAGTLRPTHDDLAILRATVRAGQPLSLTNKPLQAALKVLQEAVDASVAPPGEATAALLRQVETAAGPLWSYLFAHAHRTVVEERHFKRRTVLGEPRLRADLTTPSGETIPAYLPAAAASRLPMLPSFPAVVIAELRPREDAQEPSAEALLVWALGRVMRQAGGRR